MTQRSLVIELDAVDGIIGIDVYLDIDLVDIDVSMHRGMRHGRAWTSRICESTSPLLSSCSV